MQATSQPHKKSKNKFQECHIWLYLLMIIFQVHPDRQGAISALGLGLSVYWFPEYMEHSLLEKNTSPPYTHTPH